MPRVMRGALPTALCLVVLNLVVLATQPSTPSRAAAMHSPTPTTLPATTTTTVAPAAPSTTTTTAPAPRLAAPRPVVRSAATPTSTTRPPAVHAGSAQVACGWTWDAVRIDDGSSNELTMTLSAPSRPSQAVTITATFGGPDTAPASHATTTDASSQAVTTFAVSEDKRDWTITISATFPAGGVCPGETFTLNY